MNTKQECQWKIRTEILLQIKKQTNRGLVPAGISNRHIHLSQEDLETLFGKGHELTRKAPLSQPEQFAAEETVTLCGPKGKLGRVRVLGPVRKETQVEISITDSFTLGVKPPVRLSGDLAGTPGLRVEGPAGSVELRQGVIVAARHLHISSEEAAVYGLKDGDVVQLKKDGPRGILFDQVLVRCGKGHELEVHLDVDEANAAGLKNGDVLEIL